MLETELGFKHHHLHKSYWTAAVYPDVFIPTVLLTRAVRP